MSELGQHGDPIHTQLVDTGEMLVLLFPQRGDGVGMSYGQALQLSFNLHQKASEHFTPEELLKFMAGMIHGHDAEGMEAVLDVEQMLRGEKEEE